MRVEEKYLDVLQNIEMAIITVYKRQPALLDVEVLEAMDLLIRTYTWEEERRGTPTSRLSDRALAVFDFTRRVCEFRLGRQSLSPGESPPGQAGGVAITLPEVLLCLKRIRSSIRLWNKEGGRQGYLEYVRAFLPDSIRKPDRGDGEESKGP